MSKLLPGLGYLALPSSPETWLVEPLLPSGGAILVFGEPKVGKSFAGLQARRRHLRPHNPDSRRSQYFFTALCRRIVASVLLLSVPRAQTLG